MNLPLTIIIPARREEEVVLHTLHELRKRIKTPHKIIVVNDSDYLDKTGEIAQKYAKKHKNVSVVIKRNNKKPSFASALILGFNQVKRGFVIPVMADLCDEPETIDEMYKEINKGWDIICGSRYIEGGGKKGGPAIQSLFSTIVCLSLYYLARIPTKDVSNAFKMYRKEILNKIVINPKSGVEVSMEITLQAYFQKARITEIPTKWLGRTMGQSKFRMFQRAPKYFKIYLWGINNSIRKMLHLKLKKFTLS